MDVAKAQAGTYCGGRPVRLCRRLWSTFGVCYVVVLIFLIKCHVKFAIRYILKNMRSAPHPYSEVLLYCSRLHTYVLYYYHGSRDSPPKPPAYKPTSKQASKARRLACLGKMKRACSSAWVGESSAWVRPEEQSMVRNGPVYTANGLPTVNAYTAFSTHAHSLPMLNSSHAHSLTTLTLLPTLTLRLYHVSTGESGDTSVILYPRSVSTHGQSLPTSVSTHVSL